MDGPKPIAFFIYNPTLSTKEETAHENILFYWPPHIDLNTQMNEVGLCTAVNALQGRFLVEGEEELVADLPRGITTGFKRYTIRCFERDFFFVLVTERGHKVVPHTDAIGRWAEESASTEGDSSSAGGASQGSGGGGPTGASPTSKKGQYPVSFYKDHSDASIETVADSYITLHYRMFVMLCGSLRRNLTQFMTENKANAPTQMRRLFSRNLTRWLLPTLNKSLTTSYNYLVGSFATPVGVQYVQPNEEAYLIVSSLLARIQSVVPFVRYTAVSYQGKVLFSGLSLEDTTTLFHLIPALFDSSHLSAATSSSSSTSPAVAAAAVSGGSSASAATPPRTTALSKPELDRSPTYSEHIRREEALRNSIRGSRPFASAGGQAHRSVAASGGPSASPDFAGDTGVIGFVQELKELGGSSASNVSSSQRSTSSTSSGTNLVYHDSVPAIVVQGKLIGLLSCPVRSMRLLLLVDYAQVADPLRRQAVMQAVQEVVSADGERLVHSVSVPSNIKSSMLDEHFVYFYANRANLQVRSSILNRKASKTIGSSRDEELGAIHLMDGVRHAIVDWKATRNLSNLIQRRRVDISSDGLNATTGSTSEQQTGREDTKVGRKKTHKKTSALKVSLAAQAASPVAVSLINGAMETAPYAFVDDVSSMYFRVSDNVWVLCRHAGDREFYVAVDGTGHKHALERAEFVQRTVFYDNFSY